MAQDLRAVPRHGIIAPKEAVRMVLEQTAARQAKLLSLLRREFGLSAGLVKRLKWQNALFVNDAPAHTDAPGHARRPGARRAGGADGGL